MSLYPMNTYCNRVPMFTWPIKVDLGAGQYPREGFVRLDFDARGTDIVWDITHGIPLPDGSVSELYTSHFLEHLIPTHCHYVLQEIWRVVMPQGKVTIKVPHGDTPQGKLPCHYNLFTEDHLRAIDLWFPHDTGSYWRLDTLSRDGIHLIGEFTIIKG